MKKIKFIGFSLIGLMMIVSVKAIARGRGLAYNHTMESGLNHGRELIVEVYLDDCSESQFGPYVSLINDYGVKKQDGSSYSTLHDVSVYSYIIYENYNGTYSESNCLQNATGTGVALLSSFKLDQDDVEYIHKFVPNLVFSDGYRMYFKKAWNDNWSGQFVGINYIFRPNNQE